MRRSIGPSSGSVRSWIGDWRNGGRPDVRRGVGVCAGRGPWRVVNELREFARRRRLGIKAVEAVVTGELEDALAYLEVVDRAGALVAFETRNPAWAS